MRSCKLATGVCLNINCLMAQKSMFQGRQNLLGKIRNQTKAQLVRKENDQFDSLITFIMFFVLTQDLPLNLVQEAMRLGFGCPRKTTKVLLLKLFGKKTLANSAYQQTKNKQALDRSAIISIKGKYQVE